MPFLAGRRVRRHTAATRTSRTTRLCAMAAALCAMAAALSPGGCGLAQTHRVTKPEKVTRAIGVYEWTGEMNKPTASRLVPVSLFIDGHLVDAGVYLARPVPFAITPGYVYSVEQAGEPLGVLDLDQAQNIVTRRAQDDDNPLGAWYAYGHYTPPAAPKKQPVLQTSAHPGVIVSTSAEGHPRLNSSSATDTSVPPKPADPKASASGDDSDRPHMNRRPDASSSPAKPATDTDTAATTTSASQDDPDRPHMSRRNDTSPSTGNDSGPATTTASASPAPPAATEDDPERPTLRRREAKPDAKRKKESGSGVTAMATSLNDDPDRPTLSHGSATAPTGTPPLLGMPADLRQAIAVSDATSVDTHPFARGWESPAERASTLAAFQALARPRVANYLTQNLLQPGTALVPALATKPITSAPAPSGDTTVAPRLQRGRPGIPVTATTPLPSKAATAKPATKTAVHHPVVANPLLLQEEQITGFTLSYGGLPTFVYTAATPVSGGPPLHITLVAQQLPSGELQVALSSVTDEGHLDRTPWMRLVDVVDPSDSHRASFLFELRAKASRQFALYNLVSSRAEQSFVTRLFE